MLALNLSAACDTIDHCSLINRLQTNVGITGPSLSWLRTYLADRRQFVRIGQSTHTSVCYTAVPRRSVLEPKLFSLYIYIYIYIIYIYITIIINRKSARYCTTIVYERHATLRNYVTHRLEECLMEHHSKFFLSERMLNPDKHNAIIFCRPTHRY